MFHGGSLATAYAILFYEGDGCKHPADGTEVPFTPGG